MNRWLAASGEEDIHVVRMTKSFSFLLRQTGQVPESIPLIEKALETSRRLEVEPEELIDSLCEMADARRYQGRMEEARSVSREATELARSLFGSDDPATLRATHSWASTSAWWGSSARRCGSTRKNARLRDLLFGPSSFFTLKPSTAWPSTCARAVTTRAPVSSRRTCTAGAHAFGDEHPLTLRIARNLAVCRRRDGALAEAAKLTEETLRRFVNRYGNDHSDSLATAANLSVDPAAGRRSGQLAAARRGHRAALRAAARRRPPLHPAHPRQPGRHPAGGGRAGHGAGGRGRRGPPADRDAGERHITTLTTAIGQASTAAARMDFDRAREIDEANLPLLAEVAGEDHPLTLSCTANLALDLRGLGRGAEADELERRAVEGFTDKVRADHPGSSRHAVAAASSATWRPCRCSRRRPGGPPSFGARSRPAAYGASAQVRRCRPPSWAGGDAEGTGAGRRAGSRSARRRGQEEQRLVNRVVASAMKTSTVYS